MRLNPRINKVNYAIREIVVPARKVEKQGHEVLHLNIGDPDKYDFDTPNFIKEAMIKAVRDGKNYYGESEGNPEVKAAIARREKKYKGVKYNPNDILISAGASEAINMIFGSLIGRGDQVLLPGPGYALYEPLTHFYGAKPVEYECMEEENWQPNVDDIRKKINDKTKVMVVINPNNPTGAIYPKKTLKEITDIAIENDLLVISDEIYDLMTFGRVKFHSLPKINKDGKYIVLGGLSKVYLSPGWRMGYAIFSAPNNELDDLKEGCYRLARARLSVNTPAEVAMGAAMDGPHEHVKKTNKKLKRRADYSTKRINEIEGLSVVRPEGTLYMFPKIEDPKFKDDKKFILDLLQKKYVLMVHGSGFSKKYGRGHFRLVFLPKIEILEKAFDRLEDFMKGK